MVSGFLIHRSTVVDDQCLGNEGSETSRADGLRVPFVLDCACQIRLDQDVPGISRSWVIAVQGGDLYLE